MLVMFFLSPQLLQVNPNERLGKQAKGTCDQISTVVRKPVLGVTIFFTRYSSLKNEPISECYYVFTTVGSGLAGVEEIKAHPFFASIDWSTV